MRPRLWPLTLPFAIAVSQWWRYHDRLPERMATHFDAAGRANSWMSRQGFFVFSFGMLAFMSLVFFGAGGLIRLLPPRLVNLPNRDYWLAPERRDATIADMATRMARLGLVALLFIVAIDELVLRANVAGGDLPGAPIWIGLALVLALTAVWMVRLYRRFRLPK